MERPRLPARWVHLVLSSCAILSGCAANPPQPKLFDRLGGLPAITTVVDRTIDSAAQDPRTSRSFKGIKLQGAKESVVAQLCEATGGPCKYDGADMRKAHSDLAITSAEFDAFVQQLVATLDHFNHVVPTPYFAKTDAKGKASLDDMAQGQYQLKTWHFGLPAGASIPEQTISVAGADTSATFYLNMKARTDN